MLTEHATSTAVRPRFTRDQIAAFMPARGRFRFPAPYDTEGARITNETDCPDGVHYGYSYWPKINNHAGQDALLIVVGCTRVHRGKGPSLFSYHKGTGEVTPLGPLFPEDDLLSWHTAEGWYFSATQPTTLYVHDWHQLLRIDVLSRERQLIFAAPQGTYLWQCHSSADDRVHSATVRADLTYERIGSIVYNELTGESSLFTRHGALDECQIDKSGRWLLIKEDHDNRIVDLATGHEHLLRNKEGAVGHSDCGFNDVVGEDDEYGIGGALRRWHFTPDGPVGGELVYHMTHDVPMARHVAYGRDAVIVSCGHADDLPRANEIVEVPLDGSLLCRVLAPTMVNLSSGDHYSNLPKACVDPLGEYVLWTTNLGGTRLDAVIVKIPHETSNGPAPQTPPTTEARMRTISIIGTDWHGFNPNYRRQPFHSLDRTKREDWKNVFYELGELARVDAIAIGIRGAYQPQDVDWAAAAVAAYRESAVQPALMPWFDTVGLPDIVNAPGRGDFKFDFANDQHLAWAWDRYARLFFDHFGNLPLERSTRGKVLIAWWGISSDNGWGFTNQRYAQRLLDYIDRLLMNHGLGAADHIVDKTWIELCPPLQVYAVHDWFNPWKTPPSAYSIRSHNGVTVGVTVPSFYERINPDGDAETIRQSLAAMRAANADYVLIESGTNFIEGAELMRDSTGNTGKLDAVREHVELLTPIPSEDDMEILPEPTFCLRRAERKPHPTRPGYYTSPFPGKPDKVLCVEPPQDGKRARIAERPAGTNGEWESWREEDDRCVFDLVFGWTFAIPLVD